MTLAPLRVTVPVVCTNLVKHCYNHADCTPLHIHFLSLQSIKFNIKQKNKEGDKINIHLETSDFVNNDNHPSLLL